MHQNAVHIWISWYSKIYWFSTKKCWCQQNARGVPCDSYIFWSFFGLGITVPSFIIVGYMWQILGREPFLSRTSMSRPKRLIMNRVKMFFMLFYFCFIILSFKKVYSASKIYRGQLWIDVLVIQVSDLYSETLRL